MEGLYRPLILCAASCSECRSLDRGFRGELGDWSWRPSHPGARSCWVWQSVLWCSITIFLMARDERDCENDGWGSSRYWWLCWSILHRKCPLWRGERHWWSLQLCSLSWNSAGSGGADWPVWSDIVLVVQARSSMMCVHPQEFSAADSQQSSCW